MQAQLRVEAGGRDISGVIASCWQSVVVTDEAGFESDTVEIKLCDDRDQLVVPPQGEQLTVWLGWHGKQLVRMGTYVADEIKMEGPLRTLTIKAKAADMRASLKAVRTRSFDTTLGAIVAAVAAEHGYTARVSGALADVALHVDQAGESDLHLLTRLARDAGAVFKAAEGYLIVAPAGDGKSVSGRELPRITVDVGQVNRYAMTASSRGKFTGVRAEFADKPAATTREVIVGDAGGEVQTLRQMFADGGAATRAARARLEELTRGTGKLELTMVGNPRIRAEGIIDVVGCSTKVDGVWVVQRAVHQVGAQGFITQVSAVVPTGKQLGMLK